MSVTNQNKLYCRHNDQSEVLMGNNRHHHYHSIYHLSQRENRQKVSEETPPDEFSKQRLSGVKF
jgi:hypothetical protein